MVSGMSTDEPRRATFRHVADRVRSRIHDGTYAPGARLPTEGELADELETNRGTVAQALRLLVAEGLISKGRRGAFVSRIVRRIVRDATSRYVRARREVGQARGAFDAEIQSLGMTPKSITTVIRARPPAHVADLLGVSPDEVCTVARVRRMLADETPVQLSTSYLPLDIAEGTRLEDIDTGPGGSKSRLIELGHAQAGITETIDVRSPEVEEIEALDMAEDQRVYQITHTARTEAGRAVEVAVHVLPTHLWTLSYSWDLGPSH